jgi:hypothetical protein
MVRIKHIGHQYHITSQHITASSVIEAWYQDLPVVETRKNIDTKNHKRHAETTDRNNVDRDMKPASVDDGQ